MSEVKEALKIEQSISESNSISDAEDENDDYQKRIGNKINVSTLEGDGLNLD